MRRTPSAQASARRSAANGGFPALDDLEACQAACPDPATGGRAGAPESRKDGAAIGY